MELVRKQSRKWRELRQEFLDAQGGNCAICGGPPRRATLDHCHLDGFLRGTLCTACNVMLGWYESHRPQIEGYLARAAEHQAYSALEHTKRRKRTWLEHWDRHAKPQEQDSA